LFVPVKSTRFLAVTASPHRQDYQHTDGLRLQMTGICREFTCSLTADRHCFEA